MAWIEKRGSKWIIYDRDATGRKLRVEAAYTDRQASRQKLARYEKAKAQGVEGLIDPFKQHKSRPLTEHVADYISDLKAKGRDGKYVSNCEKRIAKLLDACGWKLLADVTADAFCHWRERLPKLDDGRPSIGPVTQNQYLEAVRAFCGWAVKRDRVATNPMLNVGTVDETADVRRARRALTPEQLAALLTAVAPTHQPVYRFILSTGLRRQEVADLVWGDVHLDSPTPFLKLRAKATKARRADSLPLRGDTADELRKLKGEAVEGDKVFTSVPTMEEHKAYLAAAGIAWEDSEGRRADLHAMRHTYGTLLSKSGVSPREAMELMRHTDLRLTMKVYTDPRIFDLSSAVERLPIPAVSVSAISATGTDGKADVRGAQKGASSTIQGHSSAGIGRSGSAADHQEPPVNIGDLQPLTPIDSDGHGTAKTGEGRNRTYLGPRSGPTAVLKTVRATRHPALSGKDR